MNKSALTLSGCWLLISSLVTLSAQPNNSLPADLEVLRDSTKRVVIGDYVRSRSRDDLRDHTVNVWTNIVDRQAIGNLVNMLSMTNELRDVGAGFDDPFAVQIFISTNEVPLRVVELHLASESLSYSIKGTFFDGRLTGVWDFDNRLDFMNYKYCQEIFKIARQTHDGLFSVIVEEDRYFRQLGKQITLEERVFNMSGRKSEHTSKNASTKPVERTAREKSPDEVESPAPKGKQ